MEVIVLHLSDLHFTDENLKLKVEAISNSINVFEVKKNILLVISGDLSNKNSGYEIAKKFIISLTTAIKTDFKEVEIVKVLFVPGNHDSNTGLDFDREKAKSVLEFVKPDYYLPEINERISLELSKLQSFFEFSKDYELFLDEKIIDKQIIKFGDYELNINLINSSLFSTIDKNDSDVGLHYIQSYDIDKLINNSNIPTITVMHHPIEWFNEICQDDLRKEIFDNSHFLLLGHKHCADGGSYSRDENDSTLILNGGAINKHDGSVESDYFAFNLDLKSNKFKVYSFNWDKDSNRYLHKVFFEDEIKIKNSSFNKGLVKNFTDEFYTDQLLNDFVPSIHELFVFPDIRINNPTTSNSLIKTLSSFKDELSKSNIIHIQGRSSSGKTTLAKKIFEDLSKEKLVIYFDASYRVRDKNLEGKIKSLVDEQYGNERSVQLFEQEPKRNKILIVDNFDKVKSDKYWISYLSSKFSKVIVLTSSENKVDIMKAIDASIMSEVQVSNMEIIPFLKVKREILITKTCLYLYNTHGVDAFNDFESITNYIGNQMKSFSFSPYLIVMYTRNYGIPGSLGKSPTKIFSHVFEMNIVNKLNMVHSDMIEPDKSMWLISMLAYESYICKEYPIKYETITHVIKRFEEEYGNKVSTKNFIDTIVSSKIMREVESNVYSFTSTTYYSYFIAKELRKEFIEGNQEVLNDLYENLLVNINSEILLFFIFLIDNNNKLLEAILSKANSFMDKWLELTLNPCNIGFIMKLDKYKVIDVPSELAKSENIESLERQEEEASKRNFEIVHKNIFDAEVKEDENQLLYKLILGIKHIRLVSNILPDFFFSMKIPLKKKFTSSLYALPNKLLYEFFKELDKDFDEGFNETVKELKGKYAHLSEDEIVDRLKNMLHSTSETLILKTYQIATQGVISNDSMKWFLKAGDAKKVTNKIMMALASSYTKEAKVFAPYLISLMEQDKNKVVVNVARSISYEYFLRDTSKSIKSEVMALHDMTFGLDGKIKKLTER